MIKNKNFQPSKKSSNFAFTLGKTIYPLLLKPKSRSHSTHCLCRQSHRPQTLSLNSQLSSINYKTCNCHISRRLNRRSRNRQKRRRFQHSKPSCNAMGNSNLEHPVVSVSPSTLHCPSQFPN